MSGTREKDSLPLFHLEFDSEGNPLFASEDELRKQIIESRKQIIESMAVPKEMLAVTQAADSIRHATKVMADTFAAEMIKLQQQVQDTLSKTVLPSAQFSPRQALIEVLWEERMLLLEVDEEHFFAEGSTRLSAVQWSLPGAADRTTRRAPDIHFTLGGEYEADAYTKEPRDADSFLDACEFIFGERPTDELINGQIFHAHFAPIVIVHKLAVLSQGQRILRRPTPVEAAQHRLWEARARQEGS